MNKIRYTLPLLPLRGITVFPGMVLHFDVGRPKSIHAVKEAMNSDKLIFLCYQNDIAEENPSLEDLAEIGTIAEIHQILNLPDGNLRVLVEGLYRGKITSLKYYEPYAEVNVSKKNDIYPDDEVLLNVLTRRCMHYVEDFLALYDRLSPEITSTLMSVDDIGELSDVIASNFPLKPNDKQRILNELDVKQRTETLIEIISDEISILSLEKKLNDKVNKNLDDNQRDYFLREKLRVINEELGEETDASSDIRKYKKQLEGIIVSDELKEKLNEEFARLERTHPNSQEYGVIQNYIETVISLPWGIKSDERYNIKSAAQLLDKEHFGLKKVKDRILEYIAVRSIGGNPKNNILCLVGPPGTGKTSIAKSLAEALNRKYVRISLGGIKNEAEIRGHRKTYIGAMPGRIIDALKKCGSSNPLMLFDEIDKMSHDMTGDPAAALLEVLDSEQNKNFRDHFVELAFDLSDTIFVTTANTLDTIPPPLLDRMDIIEVEGYSFDEKIEIAKRFLLPKQRKAHGLDSKQLSIASSAYLPLINKYTKESGVRELERKIAAICRRVAVMISDGTTEKVTVKASSLSDMLGVPPYGYELSNKSDKVGVVTGLAWTSVGGETLSVEANVMSGSGKLELTGNLGDVMQESAKIALSYIKANAFKLGIDADIFKNNDIHIHVPSGAVPKDGPSAGVTMVTALCSALTHNMVKSEVAMTGEITLTGRVTAIGGLKEKTLAALRDGIKKVIIPYENRGDFKELPQCVKDKMQFVFAKNISDVLDTALLTTSKPSDKKHKVYNEEIDRTRVISGLNIN